jgi:pimeloyl-[acyl-carrier protein] methyl ester esterase
VSGLNFQIRGRGRDLVLLHGWSLNLRVFDQLTRQLARSCRVIAIDLPGHGKSDWDAKASTPAAQLELLVGELARACARVRSAPV